MAITTVYFRKPYLLAIPPPHIVLRLTTMFRLKPRTYTPLQRYSGAGTAHIRRDDKGKNSADMTIMKRTHQTDGTRTRARPVCRNAPPQTRATTERLTPATLRTTNRQNLTTDMPPRRRAPRKGKTLSSHRNSPSCSRSEVPCNSAPRGGRASPTEAAQAR